MVKELLSCDVFVAGGGAAGMAAALSACENGASVILAEHMSLPGGVLNRCIHRGFGLAYFRENLSGTEYAERFRKRLEASAVRVMTGTTVLSVSADRTALLSSAGSLRRVSFQRCILATGSFEKTCASIPLAGTRPAGVYTAGCLQGLMNEGNFDVGKNIVILGSGNVGQIMGRQLIMAGKNVLAMIEQKDSPGGLSVHHRDCIEAYHIPLRLHSTVTELHGTKHLEGVTVKDLRTGEKEHLSCDTLITALGLIPDRTLALPLTENGVTPSWLRLCGNCEEIHDIVDSVTLQGEQEGRYCSSGIPADRLR